MLGFCTSPDFVNHLTGEHHPERPDRIRAIAHAVRQAGLVDSPNPFPDFAPGFQIQRLNGEKMVELTPITADLKNIELVHSRKMIEHIRHVCQSGGGILDLGDTPVSPRSFDVALLSCGAVLTCCDAVIDGGVRDVAYLQKIGFPVYALGIVPSTSVTHYRFAGANIPVVCDGVAVNAADIIVADADGVVVVPRASAPAALKLAQQMDFKEHSMYATIEKLKSIQEAVKQFGRL